MGAGLVSLPSILGQCTKDEDEHEKKGPGHARLRGRLPLLGRNGDPIGYRPEATSCHCDAMTYGDFAEAVPRIGTPIALYPDRTVEKS